MQDDHAQSFNVRFMFFTYTYKLVFESKSNKLVFESKTDLQVAQCFSKKILH